MRRLAVALLAALAVAPAAVGVRAHDEPATPHARATERIAMTIPDVPVLDAQGRARRFHTDLVRDRVVAINFIYTTCTTACPLLGVAFAGVQDALGERLGRDVHLISITVDPATDTPARLQAWGARYGARPGWTLVTGARPDIVRLLRALGVTVTPKEEHPSFVLVGDDRRGEWTRAWGLRPAVELVPLIERALAPGNPTAHHGGG